MKKFLFLSLCITLFACSSTTDSQQEYYDSALAALKAVREKLNHPSSIATDSLARVLMNEDSQLYLSYDEEEVSKDDLEKFKQLEEDIEQIHTRVNNFISDNVQNIKCIRVHDDGRLLNSSAYFPVYLQKGETMFIDIEMEKAGNVTIYNNDSKSVIKTIRNQATTNETFTAKYSAIYLVEVSPTVTSYASIDIWVKTTDTNTVLHPKRIKEDSESTTKGSFMSKKVDGIKMRNLFEEPRKFTLRGQLKAAFSGAYRALVPIQVPNGAKDILYSLRISTNETPAESDGNFHKNMDTSYHKIRLLGLPLYESTRNIGIISTLLGENVPPREEDAYINMYVFFDAAQARKFQNNQPIDNLKYNLDYSTIGTQSCNGRIPARGKTIYLGFENERMRYNNYVWLEAVSTISQTEYVRPKYTITEETTESDDIIQLIDENLDFIE